MYLYNIFCGTHAFADVSYLIGSLYAYKSYLIKYFFVSLLTLGSSVYPSLPPFCGTYSDSQAY